MQVSQIDGAYFPPGPQRVLTPFYDPLVLKSGHAPFPVLMRRVRGPCGGRGGARLEYDPPECARYRTPDS
jgi:hypothetical protein